MRNPLWRLIIIVAVIGACTWALIPPSKTIRLGRDLSGGVSLVYSVRMPDGANRRDVLEQTISVLTDRVNPQGVLDIAMTPMGTDRIEIVMPLPNEEIKALQGAFREALDALVQDSQIRSGELDQSLADGTAVERFGGGGEREAIVEQLQRAWASLQAAQAGVLTAEQSDDATAVPRARQALADARIKEDDLRREVLALSLDRSRVLAVLDLSDKPKPREAPDGTPELDADGNQIMDPSPRARAMEGLALEFAGVAEGLEHVRAAWEAYQVRRTGLDDPEDLMRLLKGAGVLEYHIAVQGDSATGIDIDEMRRQLAELGPNNTDSPIAAWYPVHQLKQWTDSPEELAAASSNPVGFFAAGRNLVASSRDGVPYLLMYTDQPRSMTHDRGTTWSLQSAGRTVDDLGRPAVSFRLDTNGGRLMGRLTQANKLRPMGIVLDGRVYSAPRINGTISTSGIIQGSFSNEDLAYLTRVLAAGSLEARLSPEPIAMSTLGPSIGADNLTRGVDAFLWAVLVVGSFMLVWYFFAGLVADMALLFNGLIIFGVMAMMQGTFTLPGLAGVVLTMGMAVDANVLIYERIREEIEGGARDLREAVRNGYGRVFSTIVDANVTNLIVCLVLLLMEPTTEIKGFALTLTIGIIATLFTALYCTRYVFEFYVYIMRGRRLTMAAVAFPAIGRAMRPNIDWVALRPFFWTMSLLAIAGSIVLFYSRGADMFDTEFRGGVSITMRTASDDAGTPKLLPQSGVGSVETRVRAIAQGATGDDLESSVRREFANARVLTVGDQVVDETGRTRADAFQVKVAAPSGLDGDVAIQDIVEAALQGAFEDELDVSPARRFEGAGGSDWAAWTQPIETMSLEQALPGQNAVGNLKDFQGGVLVRVLGIEPPIELDEVRSRIDRLRQDPSYTDSIGRDVQVFGLTPASDGRWSDVAVAVLAPDLNYLGNDSALVDSKVASREWALISDAMTHKESFEQVNSFAPSMAATRTANAIGAVILSLAGILFYIWLRFGSFRYSLAALAALCHDVIIVLGALALTGVIAGEGTIFEGMLIEVFQIDTGIVAALLTVIGYSLNDTIVILDRIRENRGRRPVPSRSCVNLSINQTFSRTLLTSITTLIAVLIIYIFGGTGIRGFAFALVIGVAIGTYSSIAIASPLVFRREVSGGGSGDDDADTNADAGPVLPSAA